MHISNSKLFHRTKLVTHYGRAPLFFGKQFKEWSDDFYRGTNFQ